MTSLGKWFIRVQRSMTLHYNATHNTDPRYSTKQDRPAVTTKREVGNP